jgi:hypothetical protein
MKKLIALCVALLVAACATSTPQTFSGQFQPPPDNSRVLLMTPDTQFAIMTASGLQEPREDWSNSGRDNLATALATYVQTAGHNPSTLDPTTAMEGRVGQIIRLHDAVGQSILITRLLPASLPTRREGFEWTLGAGAQELASVHNADYALFVTARGSWASGGRVAAMVGLSLLGVGIPLGGQQAFASLVDLRTGNVIWFNAVTAMSDEDMRESAGASEVIDRLMAEAPL